MKIGRNDPCWCGSGKKFKKCHLPTAAAALLPFAAIENAGQRAWRERTCLHPSAAPGVCNRVVSAHTVQRSQVLERLIDDSNHVFTFHPGSPGAPERIGWHEASTFTGFCGRHDAATFAPVETKPFDGRAEQCFLLGYRALCYEVYQKGGFLRSSPIVRDLIARGRPEAEQRDLYHIDSLLQAGASKGLEALQTLKCQMDAQLLKSDYTGWSRFVATFRGNLCVASTGGVAPNRDLDGHELQVLHDSDPAKQETMLCSVVTADDGVAVVLTWPTAQGAPRRWVESVLARGRHKLASYLVQFMFAYLENTYFSFDWWTSLGDADRRHVGNLGCMWNAYYEQFEYRDVALVPWELLDARFEDAP